MIEELKEKIRLVLKGRGYDSQSISVINATSNGIEGLQCSGAKRKWVEEASFDLSKSKEELKLALLPHILAIQSKYNVKLKMVFIPGITTTHQFFVGPEK